MGRSYLYKELVIVNKRGLLFGSLIKVPMLMGQKLKEIETMKKIICAVAAFAIIGGVASVASAEVNLNGDARARFIYRDNGVADEYTKWDSRVRVKIKATTESGAYVNARLRILDGTWDGSAGSSVREVWSDYAYIGFKTGAFNVSAGRQVANTTKWFSWDNRADRLKVMYKAGDVSVGYIYDQKTETFDATDDKYIHGFVYKQKFSDSVNAKVRGMYILDDLNTDRDGWKGTANLGMNFAGNKITVEQAWIQGDVMATDADDAFGGYASWSANFGTVTPTVMLGYTVDGYKVDDDFGWIMIGGAWATTAIDQIGQGGDTWFAGATADVATSEQLSFQGNLVYMDVDSMLDDSVLELSGKASYKVVKDADLSLKLGYLDYADSKSVVNGVVRLDVNF